jgi:hypothetical protein
MRCGWLPGPDDDDVAKAVAWWKEEAQNWRDYLEDGSYEERKCRQIIARYERRLAFFRDWELAMQREGSTLARILAGAPRESASPGHLPVLVARLVAGFVVREPAAPQAGEARPEPIDAMPSSSEEMAGQVIEIVFHEEPSTHIDPEVARTKVQLDWADQVERGLAGAESMNEGPRRAQLSDEPHATASGKEEPRPPVYIWLLTYKSHPQEFYHALVEGAPLRACREALAEINRHCVLPDSGAKVFVEPEHWDIVMANLEGRTLRPYHVVVSADTECLVEESLLAIPSRRRPKLKNSSEARELLISGNGTPSHDVDGDGIGVFQEIDANVATWTPVRTFLCSVRDLRNETSVTQSTAEHYGGAPNPRRHVI